MRGQTRFWQGSQQFPWTQGPRKQTSGQASPRNTSGQPAPRGAKRSDSADLACRGITVSNSGTEICITHNQHNRSDRRSPVAYSYAEHWTLLPHGPHVRVGRTEQVTHYPVVAAGKAIGYSITKHRCRNETGNTPCIRHSQLSAGMKEPSRDGA